MIEKQTTVHYFRIEYVNFFQDKTENITNRLELWKQGKIKTIYRRLLAIINETNYIWQ